MAMTAGTAIFEAVNIQQPISNIQWPNEEMKKTDKRFAILLSRVATGRENSER